MKKRGVLKVALVLIRLALLAMNGWAKDNYKQDRLS